MFLFLAVPPCFQPLCFTATVGQCGAAARESTAAIEKKNRKGVIPLPITDFFNSLTGGQIAGWGLAALVALLSIIQISPLKLSPWDSIFAWLGNNLNGKQLEALQKQVTTMWVNSHRGAILTFARECRANIDHSSDEWSNALCIADEYEVYCEKNHVANGIVKADTQFIRSLYQELSRERKI